MSRVKDNKAFFFQSLKNKRFKYLKKEEKVIHGLSPLEVGDFEGKIKASSSVKRKDRDFLVSRIKPKLEKIQGNYCIYCGLHKNHCGRLEREHIAPKGTYPKFMFEPQNLALACHHCNFELKKEYNTINKVNAKYDKSSFNIVHPYLDEFDKHITFAINEGKVLISSKPYSRKGKNHIKLFELDSVFKTEKRSGLIIVKEVKTLNKYDKLLEKVLSNKYVQK